MVFQLIRDAPWSLHIIVVEDKGGRSTLNLLNSACTWFCWCRSQTMAAFPSCGYTMALTGGVHSLRFLRMNPKVRLALLVMLPMCLYQARLSVMMTLRYLLSPTTSRVCPWQLYSVPMVFRHRGEILMTVHLLSLATSSAVRSSWRNCLSWSLSITLKTALSSAKSLMDDDLITSRRSLMKAKNSSGPITVPCGTPNNMSAVHDWAPSRTICCFRLLRNNCTYLLTLAFTP